MRSRIAVGALLIATAPVIGVDFTQPVPHPTKENFLPSEFFEPAPPPPQLALEIDQNETILIEKMKGVLLLGSLDLVNRNPEGEGVVFKELDLPGAEEKLAARLRQLIVGQPLTYNRISALKREIISFYQAHDHPVVLVVVPEQDVTDGVLQVGVIEGKVGAVIGTGGRYFSSERMLKKFHLPVGSKINTHKLLTDISWANQNPFRQTNVVFQPGKDSGTTDINIITNDRFPVRVYVGGDSTGNKLTGENRWYTGFNWGDVFGLDQNLSFQYTVSSEFHRLQSYNFNYTIPLPWQHKMTFMGGYSEVNPKTDKTDKSTAHGWSGQANFRYIIPVGKTYGNWIQNAQVGYDLKLTNNEVEFNSSTVHLDLAHINQFLASYYIGYTPQGHKINADVDLYFSPGNWYGKENKKAFDGLQESALPTYVYVRAALGDEWQIPKTGFNLYLMGRGQIASRTLLPSEQYGLGGYDTVRGYVQRVINYDNAFCLNCELRAPSFSIIRWFSPKRALDTMTLLGFIDYGMGWPHTKPKQDDNGHTDPRSQTLVGVGPGLRYRMGPSLYLRLDYGFPLTTLIKTKASEKTEENSLNTSPTLDFGLLLSY